MKFLPLILLLLVFISLNASAYDPYSSESEDEAIEVDPELSDEDAQREIESAGVPEITPPGTKPFEQEEIAKRLNNEMNFLNTDSQLAKSPTPPTAVQNAPTNKTEIADLEEKINFRAAAVKKEDNLRADEVDASDLDSENFQ